MSYAQNILAALPALTYIGVMRTSADEDQLDAKDLSLSSSCVYFRVIHGSVSGPQLEALGEHESLMIHGEMLLMQPSQ